MVRGWPKGIWLSWSAAKAAGKTAAFLVALWCARLRGVICCFVLYIYTVKGEIWCKPLRGGGVSLKRGCADVDNSERVFCVGVGYVASSERGVTRIGMGSPVDRGAPGWKSLFQSQLQSGVVVAAAGRPGVYRVDHVLERVLGAASQQAGGAVAAGDG